MMTYYRRLNLCGRASTQLAIQFNSNRQGSVTYVASRGRPLKEDNQTIGSVRNPNYLGIVELRSQFDPFLCENIRGCGNARNEIPSYLPFTICEDFIEFMELKHWQRFSVKYREQSIFQCL
jgi:hypothetical protein